MATDFSYNGKTINISGPAKPSGKNQPLDPRTEVKLYADIESIPSPYIGMIITVLEDETNSNKMTDYKVLSLKANASGIANSVVDQVQRYVDYLGAGNISQDDINTAVNNYLTEHPVSSGATAEQAAQIQANKTAIGDANSGLIKEVNNIKNTELQNLNTAIQTLETLVGVDEALGDKSGLPSGDANVIASINRIDAKPTVTSEEINNAVNSYFIEHPSADGVFLTKVLTTEEITAILGSAPVVPTDVEVQSIVIVNNHFEVNVGETVQLEYIILPSNATDKTVTWSSSEDSIATVSNTGLVTTKSAGSALITATTSNGKIATAEVIANEVTEVVEVTGLTLSEETLSLKTGDTKTLTVTILPENATNKSIRWVSSDVSKATVVNGKVTALAEGSVIIKAISSENSNIYAECSVEIIYIENITSIRDGLIGEYDFATLSGDSTEVYALNDKTKKITFTGFNDIASAKTNIGLSCDSDECVGTYSSSGITDKITVALSVFLKEHTRSVGLFKVGNISLNTGQNNSEILYSVTKQIGYIGSTKSYLQASKIKSDALVMTIDKVAPSLKVYINGLLGFSSTSSDITTNFTNVLKIMSGYKDWQHSSSLIIANNLIYDRILKEEEIVTISDEIRRLKPINTNNSTIQTANSKLLTHIDISSLTGNKIVDYVQGLEITPTSTTEYGFICDGTDNGLYIPNTVLTDRTLVFKSKLEDGYLIYKVNGLEFSITISGQKITSTYSNKFLINKDVNFNKGNDCLFIAAINCDIKTLTYTIKLYINNTQISSTTFTSNTLYKTNSFVKQFNNSILINQYLEYDTILSDDEISNLVSEMGV